MRAQEGHPQSRSRRRLLAAGAGVIASLGALLPATWAAELVAGGEAGSSVEERIARAIARSLLGLPGGLALAIWSELERADPTAPRRYGTRFLWRRQQAFRDYPDFLRRFGPGASDPEVLRSRALLINVHAAHGLGMQVASDDIEGLSIPATFDFNMSFSPLEFVSLARMRADLGDRYTHVIMGQCQPRACLRFLEAEIPVGKELFRQIRRLSATERQLSIVRNLHEDIFLVGTRVVTRERYVPRPASRPPRIVVPDITGALVVHRVPERSSMIDVWVLAGKWSDRPAPETSKKRRKPTAQMISLADQRVRAALAAERAEARAHGLAIADSPDEDLLRGG